MKNENPLRLSPLKDLPKAWHRAVRSSKRSDQMPAGSACEHGQDESGACCRRHVVVLPGYGKREYPFPTPDELVSRAIAYFNEMAREYERMGAKLEIGSGGLPDSEEFARRNKRGYKPLSIRPFNSRRRRNRSPFNEKVMERVRARMAAEDNSNNTPGTEPVSAAAGDQPAATVASSASGTTLRVGAGTLAHIMHMGRYKAIIAQQFDPYKGAVNWALQEMPEKYRPEKYRDTAESLRDQLAKLESVYSQALPRVVQFLSAQYPDATDEELLEAAVSLLNEQLREILTVLSIWTDSFAQRRDGMYTQLEYVHFLVEQALRLFQTGDALATEDTGIKTHAFHVGDVFMARFSDQGPATVPGGRGPVGAHAIEVPHDEQDVVVIYGPLYGGHEFYHDFYNDVEGLPESMTEAVVNAIQKASKEGKFKLSSATVKLGKQEVPTLALITQLFALTLPETAADIAGGVSLTGEGYGYSMLTTFSAFNIRGYNPVAINRLLRHGSVFLVGDQGELAFEPHLPDYLRVHSVADAMDNRGFPEAAADFRKLADLAVGHPRPTHAVWRNSDPTSKYKFEIRLAIDDLRQVLPVVVDAILNAKLPALNGLSTSDMVNWTKKRQEKVDALMNNLVNGSAKVPFEMGDFWAPYVSAAAIKALWKLWEAGQLAPPQAVEKVEALARQMMDQVKERFEQLELAAQTPDPADEDEAPDNDPASESDATAPDGNQPKQS